MLATAAGLATSGTALAAPIAPNGFTVTPFATAPAGTTPVTKGPDDITLLDGNVYVTWQNGVAKTGGTPPAPTNSTVIEYSPQGRSSTPSASWAAPTASAPTPPTSA